MPSTGTPDIVSKATSRVDARSYSACPSSRAVIGLTIVGLPSILLAVPGPLSFDPIAEARRQWEHRSWDEPAAMAAATSIVRAQQLVLAAVDGALRPLGL